MRTRCVVIMLALGWLAVMPAVAEPVALTFLHVNDIYDYHAGPHSGGLAELSTLLKRRRAEAAHPLFTFGGDLISPSLASAETKGAHLIALFNQLGPVAAVPGNHEFDFGPAVFAERIAESRFPWIGSNILGADGTAWGGLAPTRIITAGGITVGFLGILTRETAALASTDGLILGDEIEAARAAVRALREQGATVVVALTHLGIEQDRALALAVPGIDLILGGHDHAPMALREGGALILKAGQDAEWLGEVEMEAESPDPGCDCAAAPPRPRLTGWRFLSVRGFDPDPALAPVIAATDSLLARTLDQPVAVVDLPLDSRTASVRGGEAAIGNLVADALRAHFGADVALINGGGLRGNRDYPAGGVLTRRDVLRELPFGNQAMLVELGGAELRAILEHGLTALETGAGRFPQVSGLTVTFDPAAPPGRRVGRVTVGGQPLDPARRYRLATTDYLVRGGDGYAGLTAARVLVAAESGPLLANLVGDSLAAAGRVSARIDGRLLPMR